MGNSAAWCIGQYTGLRRSGLGFDAALGFDFTHFLMSISEWGRVVAVTYARGALVLGSTPSVDEF